MYDAQFGVFTSPDPLRVSGAGSQAFNPYAYANNDPVNLFDPTGLQAEQTGSDTEEPLPEVVVHGERPHLESIALDDGTILIGYFQDTGQRDTYQDPETGEEYDVAVERFVEVARGTNPDRLAREVVHGSGRFRHPIVEDPKFQGPDTSELWKAAIILLHQIAFDIITDGLASQALGIAARNLGKVSGKAKAAADKVRQLLRKGKQGSPDGKGHGAEDVVEEVVDDVGEKVASTPVGRRGSPLDVPRGTNTPTTIGGRYFTGHALDQMQGRGVTPTVVENAIQHGARSAGNQPGTYQHIADGVSVITNDAGGVITVITR